MRACFKALAVGILRRHSLLYFHLEYLVPLIIRPLRGSAGYFSLEFTFASLSSSLPRQLPFPFVSLHMERKEINVVNSVSQLDILNVY